MVAPYATYELTGVDYYSLSMSPRILQRIENCNPYVKQVPFSVRGFQRIPLRAYGVYGIWYRRRCIYVGKACRQPICVRLGQHWDRCHNSRLESWIKAKGNGLRVAFMVVPNKQLIPACERFCINRFQPLTNRVRYHASDSSNPTVDIYTNRE